MEWGLACEILPRLSLAIRIFPFKFTRMTSFIRKPALAAFIITLLALPSCTKYADRDDGRFRCECGNLEWNGRDLELRMAEVVTIDSVTFAYHVIADLRTQTQIEAGIPLACFPRSSGCSRIVMTRRPLRLQAWQVAMALMAKWMKTLPVAACCFIHS